jgi:outer membrane protein OmpA-like peptidoglycan-associated protein
MKRIIFLLFVVSTPFLPAQTAAEVESVLSTQTVNFAQASRFVLTITNLVDETIEPRSAYALAQEWGWLPGRASSNRSIRLGELCFLIMRAFNIKGSFLYTLFPGPHYAFRELAYLRLIPGQRDPGIRVSGERFLQILGMVAAYTEIDRQAEAPKPVVVVEVPKEVPAPRPAAAVETPKETPAPEPAGVAEAPKEALAPRPAAAAEAPKEAPIPEPAVVAEAPKEVPIHEPAVVAEAPKEAPIPEPVVVVEAPKETPVPEPVIVAEAPKEVPAPRPAAAAETPKEIPAPRPVVAVETPKETLAVEKIGIIYANEIQFLPDSAELTEMEKAKLREIAAILPKYPNRKILIGGYTVLAGSLNGRQQISMNRAQAAADFLLSLNVCREEELIVRGYGAARPLQNNTTAEGKAANRRAEIIVLDEGYYSTQFLPDSAELTEAGKAKMRELAAVLARYPDINIRVEGHTAMAGGQEGRLRISRNRAQAVVDVLTSLNIHRGREITAWGYGATRPLGDNTTEEGKAINRRVDIILVDK